MEKNKYRLPERASGAKISSFPAFFSLFENSRKYVSYEEYRKMRHEEDDEYFEVTYD